MSDAHCIDQLRQRDRNSVVGQATLYDEFFHGMGDPNGTRRKAKTKAGGKGGHRKSNSAHKAEPVREFRWKRGLPPYFEGDWWTLQAETVVKTARWQQPKRLLRQLMEHQLNRQGIFNSPVDVTLVPDYRRIIKHPMDLGAHFTHKMLFIAVPCPLACSIL